MYSIYDQYIAKSATDCREPVNSGAVSSCVATCDCLRVLGNLHCDVMVRTSTIQKAQVEFSRKTFYVYGRELDIKTQCKCHEKCLSREESPKILVGQDSSHSMTNDSFYN